MLYTYLPEQQVMENGAEHSFCYISAIYLGEEVTLTKGAGGDYCINRLISTNPSSYLKKEFMPGAVVNPGSFTLL